MSHAVYQTAVSLIKAHGPKVAWQHAVIQAMQQADLSSLATWASVIEAIDELTRTRRRSGEEIQ